jgi:bifunctional non-homologous end joining protein LigD
MATLQSLSEQLRKRETAKPPAEVPRADAPLARWVKPDLVAEVAFAEFTSEGVIRHGSFLGLRGDKKASAVVEEKPQPLRETVPAPAEDGVKISNPERVVFPGDWPADDNVGGQSADQPGALSAGPGQEMLLPEA